MKRNENATCGNCPYWYALDVEIGECRQDNAKVIDQDDGALVFPLVFKHEWCGQHPEFWLQVENMYPCCVQSVCDQYVTGETKHVGDGHYYPEGT